MKRAQGRRNGVVIAGVVAVVAALVAPACADTFDVAIGKAVFDRLWVQAPASTQHADGLGPLFAARSCASCHAAGAGRTTFRLDRDDPAMHPGLVMRLGDAAGAPDPVYGAELQPEGVAGARGEGRAAFALSPAGKPRWRIAEPGYGAIAAATSMSARVAPSLGGLGLLARVPEAAVLARADEQRRDGGVSGRPHWVETPEGRRLGRFGWKASEPTVRSQAASAFALDLGLSTSVRRDPAGDCTQAQANCRAAPSGAGDGGVEVADVLLANLVTFLERRPPPPAPEAAAPRGEKLFAAAGCGSCHAATLPLDDGGEIAPFTDLLLHDMGDGLDDGVGEGGAASAEWRSAPLWGLSRALAQGSGLLHDGRAATVEEAVRWHGGAAAPARARFDALSASDRNALITYVNRL